MKTRFSHCCPKTSAKVLLLSFAVVLFPFAIHANNPKPVKPVIKEAVVFLNRAQLSSQASVTVEGGHTEIILEALPYSIDPQSIQISGKGNFTIMGVKYEHNYVNHHKKSPEMVKLEDSLKFYSFQLNTFKDFEDVMRKEEQMLISNQTIGGKDEALDADDLEYFADFFRKRLLDIRFQILKNQQDVKMLSDKVNNLRAQISSLGSQNQPTGVIKVVVAAKARTDVALDINYVVSNAGWYPLYDLRIKDTQSPANLSYKAKVYQTTGTDWKDVKIKLSTANPSLSGVKPVLLPNYLNFNIPVTTPRYRSMDYEGAASQPEAQMAEMNKEMNKKAKTVADYTQSVETSLAVEFRIGAVYTVPNGPDGQLVDIQSLELPALYKHHSVPKLSESAYLMALVSGYDDKNLISGTANIYFEGGYVGETYIDMNNTSDTLEISLGRDNNVVVERKAVKEFRSKSFIGSNRKEEFAYEISIRNTKNEPIELTLLDQIPVSQNNQIEVELIDGSGAQKDQVTGQLLWKKNILGAQTEKVVFRYSVKYPKNKQISGLR